MSLLFLYALRLGDCRKQTWVNYLGDGQNWNLVLYAKPGAVRGARSLITLPAARQEFLFWACHDVTASISPFSTQSSAPVGIAKVRCGLFAVDCERHAITFNDLLSNHPHFLLGEALQGLADAA